MIPINILNRKVFYEYELHEKLVAGIQLTGSEIKSIRNGKASIAEAYCYIRDNELWIKNMHIAEYALGGYANHEPKRERKLLAKKNELRRLKSKIEEKGFTIVPLKLFINNKGLAKLEIAVARGKKLHDKRESIKKRELDREMRKEEKYRE